jgi:hypothetical protein
MSEREKPVIISAETGWRVVVPVWENDQVVDISLEPVIGWLISYLKHDNDTDTVPITIEGLAGESVLRRPDDRYVAVGDRDLAGRADVIAYLNKKV